MASKPRTPTFFFFFIFFLLSLSFLQPHNSNQLHLSQYQAVMKIKQQLNFPEELISNSWSENEDFCNSEPTEILSLACYDDNITQLHITGNYWFPHLSPDFSTLTLFSNIAFLPNLKVLSLVSLGLQGPIPPKIGSLSSLEILNVSSNSFYGSIPREISLLKNLQTLIMDHNNLSGQIPTGLSSLRVLSLKNNSFNGSLPNELSNMVSLRALVLSGNNLSGLVPDFQNLTNLQVLDLGDNKLGPDLPTIPKKIVTLALKKNKFHSALPDEINSCYYLQTLDLSSNQLTGIFPPSLFSLPSLSFIDIGGNKFTGKLLQNISCNAQLVFVNMSENRMTGDLPDCLERRTVLYDGNCLSGGYENQNPFAFCHSEALAVGIQPKKEEKRDYGKAVLASSTVGGVVGAIAVFGVAFLFVKKEFGKQNEIVCKNAKTRFIVDNVCPVDTFQLLKDARYISETMKLGALGIPPYRTFVLDELKEATSNFNDQNLIGEGSYGQVYKGWLTDGNIVAIRSLKVKRKHNTNTYTHQLELISKLRHCHLVSAIGHCFEFNHDDSNISKIFIVFEYVPNGTLRNYISDHGQKFSWTQRIAAAIEVGRGIQFLHTGIVPGVYSNGLKITDVLMDHDLHVKISKYNLPLLTENRRLDETEVSSSRGSKDNLGSKLRSEEKSDMYDFGVILLEIIVGREIISSNDINISKDILSVSLSADSIGRASIVDPSVHKECSDDSLKTLIELCMRCLSSQASERPSVEDVLWNLQFAAQIQESSRRDCNSNQDSQ